MKRVTLFCIDGFEEIEALTVVDVLRRAGVEIKICSVNNSADLMMRGKHDIFVKADMLLNQFESSADLVDMIVIPGGTTAYLENDDLMKVLADYYKTGKYMAAICAAPAVFAELGILENRSATIYPGMESYLANSEILSDNVVVDGQIITSRGPATALEFALKLVETLEGSETMNKIKADLLA